jgi:hypothetical protein
VSGRKHLSLSKSHGQLIQGISIYNFHYPEINTPPAQVKAKVKLFLGLIKYDTMSVQNVPEIYAVN